MMTFRYLTFTLLLASGLLAGAINAAGQNKTINPELYTVSGIPDSLKENANAVIRYADKQLTVKAPGKQLIKYHSITTVLNEKGDHEAEQIFFYNKKYDYYNYIDIKIYGADGKLIKKYHKSDMYDRAASDEETIVTDERLLALQHVITSYPTTVEIEYEENVSSSINLYSWQIQDHYKIAVQQSSCKVSIDPSLGFRYKAKNIKLNPVKSNEEGLETYSWQVSNLKALKPDDDALSWQVLPKVLFVANKFDYYGNAGQIDSWENFGKWVQQLNAQGTDLSPDRVQQIRQMTDSIKTDKGKARFLYHYMQQNMRYISIQLGVGGFKPFTADFVDQKRYGDCKALSNYMAALLKAVGIPSYYSIIRAGTNQEPSDPAFPDNSFNHAVLCIPFKNDTTWLECTSNTMPFGKLGSFTENRNALIITESGGKLINTPRSIMADNQLNSNVHLTLNADGGAKAQVKLMGSGGYRESYIALASLKPDEQKEALINNYNMRQPAVMNIAETDDRDGVKEVDLDLEYDRFCDVMSGDKQFYRPRVFDLWAITLPPYEHRKNDFYFEHPMQKSCTTIIDLPAGFEAEAVPANVNLHFDYGDYLATYAYDKAKNQVTSTVKFNMNTQVIPAKKYAELQQYLDNIMKAQSKKLVIHRKSA